MLAHEPVLLEEAITALNILPDGIYIDGTFGRGGHSHLILKKLGNEGQLVALDKDASAQQAANENFLTDKRFSFIRSSFRDLLTIAKKQKIEGKVAGILLYLGMSSAQVNDPQRGFSFLKNGPLDMRMDNQQGFTAQQWIANAKEDEIIKVLKEYGEERFARRLARAIISERTLTPIETTEQLASIISKANPRWEKYKHPATRSFQAIRIHINNELEDLKKCLEASLQVLMKEGRLVVISFHSLEDRIVKYFIREHSHLPEAIRHLPFLPIEYDRWIKLKSIGKSIKPSVAEIARNPRSRSAILRVAEKLS